jgi:hypothetical protein
MFEMNFAIGDFLVDVHGRAVCICVNHAEGLFTDKKFIEPVFKTMSIEDAILLGTALIEAAKSIPAAPSPRQMALEAARAQALMARGSSAGNPPPPWSDADA